jgi:hypothetical protein
LQQTRKGACACGLKILARRLCSRCYQREVTDLRAWRPCVCGCGEWTQGARGFVSGHNTRTLTREEQGRRGRYNTGDKQRDQYHGGQRSTYRKRHGRHEHRQVVEAKIGRNLRRRDYVHHINENPRDNSIYNLALLTPAEHARLHMRGRLFQHAL